MPTDVPPSGGRHRVLFCTLGSRGDIHPYVAVASALIARGVAATIGTGEDHRETITRAGVGFALVPPSRADFEGGEKAWEYVMHPTRGGDFIFHQIVVPWLERTHAATLAAAREHDLIVGHPLAFTAPLAAEQLGKPYVYSVLQPMILFSAHDPPVIPPAPWLDVLRRFGPLPYRFLYALAKVVTWRWALPLRRLRAGLGLPRDPRHPMLGGLVSPTLNLALFSPVLGPPQVDWPANTVATGACHFDDPHAASAPGELARFLDEGSAPVLFTLGSAAVEVASEGPRFFAAALKACRAIGRRCVLLAGRQGVATLARAQGVGEGAADTGCLRLGDGALAAAYAPFSQVMPRCAAVVHQCGAGTTAEALRAGVPQVCVPFAHDQPDNAARLVRLGVAEIVKRARVNERRLAAALGRVLDPARGCVARATAIGERVRSEDGAKRAADEIVRVLEARRAPAKPADGR